MTAAELTRYADRAMALAGELSDDRAAGLLTRAAEVLRAGAGCYEADPTLRGDPAHRDRPLDLLAELGRQLLYVVRQAVNGDGSHRWPIAERWAQAEAMVDRMPAILQEGRAAVADTSTPEGSRRVSGLRLAAAASDIQEAAAMLRRALRPALALPHPDPAAVDLAALADRISEHSPTP